MSTIQDSSPNGVYKTDSQIALEIAAMEEIEYERSPRSILKPDTFVRIEIADGTSLMVSETDAISLGLSPVSMSGLDSMQMTHGSFQNPNSRYI